MLITCYNNLSSLIDSYILFTKDILEATKIMTLTTWESHKKFQLFGNTIKHSIDKLRQISPLATEVGGQGGQSLPPPVPLYPASRTFMALNLPLPPFLTFLPLL